MSQKHQKLKRQFTFDIPKFKFQKGLEQKTSNFLALLRQTYHWKANAPKNVQVLLQVPNLAEIVAPELLGGQSERVVRKKFHTFSC